MSGLAVAEEVDWHTTSITEDDLVRITRLRADALVQCATYSARTHLLLEQLSTWLVAQHAVQACANSPPVCTCNLPGGAIHEPLDLNLNIVQILALR
jgi:hypothetical protein